MPFPRMSVFVAILALTLSLLAPSSFSAQKGGGRSVIEDAIGQAASGAGGAPSGTPSHCAAFLGAQPTGITGWWRRTRGDARTVVSTLIQQALSDGRSLSTRSGHLMVTMDHVLDITDAESRKGAFRAILQLWAELSPLSATQIEVSESEGTEVRVIRSTIHGYSTHQGAYATQIAEIKESAADLLIEYASARSEKPSAMIRLAEFLVAAGSEMTGLLQKTEALPAEDGNLNRPRNRVLAAVLIAEKNISRKRGRNAALFTDMRAFTGQILSQNRSGPADHMYQSTIVEPLFAPIADIMRNHTVRGGNPISSIQNHLSAVADFGIGDPVRDSLFLRLLQARQEAVYTELFTGRPPQGTEPRLRPELALEAETAAGKLTVTITSSGSLLFFEVAPQSVGTMLAGVEALRQNRSSRMDGDDMQVAIYPHVGFGVIASKSGAPHEVLSRVLDQAARQNDGVDGLEIRGGVRYKGGLDAIVDSLWCNQMGIDSGVPLARHFNVVIDNARPPRR